MLNRRQLPSSIYTFSTLTSQLIALSQEMVLKCDNVAQTGYAQYILPIQVKLLKLITKRKTDAIESLQKTYFSIFAYHNVFQMV